MSPAKNVKEEPKEGAEEEITVDMSTAKTLAPLDPSKPYLMAVSKWKYGKTANGKKLDYGFTVIKPEDLEGRTVAGSSSLENEYTLGFVQSMLIGLGFDKDAVKSPKFKMPKEADMDGLQAVVIVRTRAAQGIYGERSEISRFAPADSYPEDKE